jgi:putative transposase
MNLYNAALDRNPANGTVRAKLVEAGRASLWLRKMTKRSPFRYFKTSPEVIRMAVMMYIQFPLSLRNVEDLLHERGIDISHETVRFWWNRFGPLFAAEIRRRRVDRMCSGTHWQWHLDEVLVKINGEQHYLWRAVNHEGEVLESFVTKRRDRKSALKFLRKTMKRHGSPQILVTDKLRSYGAAMKVIGSADKQETGRWLNNRAENSHQPLRRRELAMIRFRRMRTLQRFVAVHASIHNHFNQDRSLSQRDHFKANRTAALAEWRGLCAA